MIDARQRLMVAWPPREQGVAYLCSNRPYACGQANAENTTGRTCVVVIRIRSLWLLVTDRFGRTVGKPDLHAPWADPIAALALVRSSRGKDGKAIHASRHCCN